MWIVLATALYVGEITQGLTKVCYYDHQGSIVAITVEATKICPLSIEVSKS